MDRRLTPEELAKCAGQNGHPVCVAVDGVVYDVSESKLWKTGQHMKRHPAGRDLTVELGAAPHGREVLDRTVVKRMGVLDADKAAEEGIPPFLAALFRRFPILRRHPHPMMVHFPMAYLMGGAFFMLLDLLAPRAAPFESMAFALLVLAALFTPPAIGTGLLTWWVNYGGQRQFRILRKLQWAIILALLEIICLVLRARGPIRDDVAGGIYFAVMLAMAGITVILGYHGGHLTFPYERK